ncbi:MAG: metallophosphoesterase [Isosphaeraceae bacterium]
MTRRKFLGTAGALAAGAAGVGAYTWRVEPHWVEVIRRDLPIRNLPEALQGRTLVQLSDLHIGNLVDPNYLIDCFQLVADLDPTFTVITGDFMSCRGPEQLGAVSGVMKHLKPGPLGAYAVLGNHDYALKWGDALTADRLCGRLADLGIEVLRNQARDVAGLTLVGLDDLWAGRFRPEEVMPGLDPKKPALALSHNPDTVDQPGWSDFRGWILSGHTHGGQCKPPFLPPPLLSVSNRRYTRGAFDLGDGRNLYINAALGYIRRVRFGVRPEITAFRMIRSEA